MLSVFSSVQALLFLQVVGSFLRDIFILPVVVADAKGPPRLYKSDNVKTTTTIADPKMKSSTKCGVYLAPSTIPGAGLGVFAGDHDYNVGDTVTLGDVIIPIHEYYWNTEKLVHKYNFLWDEYNWSVNSFLKELKDEVESASEMIDVASPGVGAAANCYLSLVNVDDTSISVGNGGMTRESPGIGAISPYHGRSFFAKKHIPAGGEIFVDYGSDYFETRTGTYGYIPLPSSYRMSDQLIKAYLKMKMANKNTNLRDNIEFWNDMWDMVLQQAPIWKTSRILNGLPDYETISKHKRKFLYSGGSAKQHYQRSIRDISWLEEHGQCMDNIKVGDSQIPDAGRGAFATRFIAEGGLVAPAPLIHIPDSSMLKMFTPITDRFEPDRVTPDDDGPITYQLLLNYCFGHEESSLLLCPYGLLTSYINHSYENPNTKIEWSMEMRHPEWREQSMEKFADVMHSGVSIDFVALRDIEEDEEILIDYGETWQVAWEQHTRTFVPRDGYVPAHELNDMENVDYRTVEDDNPYEVDGTKLLCKKWYVNNFYPHEKEDVRCQILRKIDEDQYLVQLLDDDETNSTNYLTRGILWNVPSDAFEFVDMPNMRDHLQFNAFRHEMMFPDDIFPEAWKNMKEEILDADDNRAEVTTPESSSSTGASKCGVYLAPSSIPGAGLGMFAGHRDYAIGETVTLGDVVIPIVELEWNIERLKINHRFLWDEYTWNGSVFPGMEEEGDDVELVMAASPGVGSAANSYLTLVNVEDEYTQMSRGMAGDSPGVGGISPYHGRSFYATAPIPAGGEIFDDYGVSYFSSRTHTYGYLPLPGSFKTADKLIEKFVEKKKSARHKLDGNEELWNALWDTVREQASIWETSRVLNALPENQTRFDDAFFEAGGTGKLHLPKSIRDLAWLEEHGQCMDNIKVGESTNPDAGRGAFANRFIPKGGLVSPAPLIHIPDSRILKMFRPMDDKKNPERVTPDIDGPMTYQLLLNYCFGHKDSSLLLCPYGLLSSYINHSNETPNTRIAWSKEMRHPEWLEDKIERWGDTYHTGLAIDFIALRDIEEGEEIFIDYGDAWQEAWEQHVQTFVPREGYFPAFELNEKEDLEYRTVEDKPYEVDGVQLWCMKWYIEKFYTDADDDMQCQILKKLGDDQYMVQLLDSSSDDESGQTHYATDGILWNVPSDAIEFVDIPFSRDHLQFDAFRHAMMIPDDMFPDLWKRESPTSQKENLTLERKNEKQGTAAI